ncbi:hypothetical protein AgCh_024768 [Apium graveolens]
MDLNPRFERHLRISECTSNEMRVPHAFCEKYGHRIPSTVRVLVRNGYELWVDFDRVSEKFRGLGDFFHDFGMKSGNTLVFQYGGDFDMKVCILDIYDSEIQYPPVVHNLQTCAPSNVSIYEGGWSFVRYLGWGGKGCDSVYVPYEFDDHVGALIPERVDFVVSSGRDKFAITAIDTSHIDSPLSPVPPPSNLNGCTAFEIVIQKFHLLPHEHGVDIPVEFKELSNRWLKKDHISAYIGEIPKTIGGINGLESLDLSSNALSGAIPHTLTNLDFLGILNLSYNNLSGEVPKAEHFDTLDQSGFYGNEFLCGAPDVKILCDNNEYPTTEASKEASDAADKFQIYDIIAM